MKAYKLTNNKSQTYSYTQWGPGVTHETDGSGGLCGPGWIHFYDDPHLAVVFNPLHANFLSPILWEAEAEGTIKKDYGIKFGCTKLTTIRKLPFPSISLTQKIAFAILCAKTVDKGITWNLWADAWLKGSDGYLRDAYDAAAYVANTVATNHILNLKELMQEALKYDN